MKQFSPKIYPEWGELISELPVNKQAEIFNAILKYPTVDIDSGVWRFIKSQIDRDFEEFEARCKKNGEISRNYWKQKRYPTDTERYPERERESEREAPPIKAPKGAGTPIEFSESFETFWSVYPKKRAGSKEKAFKAYQSALRRKNATAEEINRVAAIYAKSDEVSRGFAKGAAAWLNDDRFLNDYGGSGGAAAPKSEIDDNAPVYYDAESGSGRVLGKWYYNYTDFSKARAEYWEREKNGELAN